MEKKGLFEGSCHNISYEKKNSEPLGGGNFDIYYFHSEFVGKMNSPILAFAYFSNGLVVQPPTRKKQGSGLAIKFKTPINGWPVFCC